MNKSTLIIILFAVILFSCKKDKNPIANKHDTNNSSVIGVVSNSGSNKIPKVTTNAGANNTSNSNFLYNTNINNISSGSYIGLYTMYSNGTNGGGFFYNDSSIYTDTFYLIRSGRTYNYLISIKANVAANLYTGTIVDSAVTYYLPLDSINTYQTYSVISVYNSGDVHTYYQYTFRLTNDSVFYTCNRTFVAGGCNGNNIETRTFCGKLQ